MNAIMGLIMVAIGVYIGVNLMPGLNTTIATITTPTYSAGVAGLTGVKRDSPFIWRHMKQTLNIGGNLKWQYRGTAQKWEARNDYQGEARKSLWYSLVCNEQVSCS